jgi:hypothetical protein
MSIPLIQYSYVVEVFIFLWIYRQSAGLLGHVIGLSQGLYLNTEQHKHRINAHTHTHTPSFWKSVACLKSAIVLGNYDCVAVASLLGVSSP